MRFPTSHVHVACHRGNEERRALQAPADRWRHAFSVAGLVALTTLSTDAVPVLGQGEPPLPARIDSYIKSDVKLTPQQQKQLLAGQPVTQLLDTDPAKEVAIFGAVWVKAPAARYVEAVKDIEAFEKGGNFLVTKRISSPPRLEDFDKLTLSPEDISDLKMCKVGDCEVKLGDEALTRIQRETDWSKPTATADVERSIRALALEYATGYLEGGNSRLAVYRDAERPTFVAQEFAALVDRMPALTDHLPDLKKYLWSIQRSRCRRPSPSCIGRMPSSA